MFCRDKWEALKANLHDIDDKMVDEGYAVTLKSLDEHKEEVFRLNLKITYFQ